MEICLWTAQGTAWEGKKSPEGQRELRGGWRIRRPGVCTSIWRGVRQRSIEDEAQPQTSRQTERRKQQREAHHQTQLLRKLRMRALPPGGRAETLHVRAQCSTTVYNWRGYPGPICADCQNTSERFIKAFLNM